MDSLNDLAMNQPEPNSVSAWHFPMMNDPVRNAAYEKALKSALKNGGVVLDIGSGSGLLAMMAARAGATRVITCEEIPHIAAKATQIIEENGYADTIQVLNKLSTKIVVGQDMPERADILVAEVFDDGLLGECAFETIEHARKHLLKPDAQIIPCGARVFAVAIESQELFENTRVEKVSGFDLSAFNEFSSKGFSGYYLEKIKHRVLTEPLEIFNFDFKNIPDPESVALEFKILHSGHCHAIAYWFELKLDNDTVISTAPGLPRLSCWRQAIQVFERTQKLTEGSILRLKAHHDDEAIWFSAT